MRSEVPPHVLFLTNIFYDFDTQKVSYCLLRNYVGLPEEVNDDLDILVKASDLEKVESILMSLMNRFHLIRRVERNGHLQFIVASEDELGRATRNRRKAQVVELDFVTNLQWKGISYLGTEDCLSERERYRNFYIPSEKYRIAHLIFHVILDKNFIKSKYKKIISEMILKKGAIILSPLIPFVGSSTTNSLYLAVLSGDDTRILQLRPYLIVRLLFHRMSSMFFFCAFMTKKMLRIARAILSPPGILIASAGPDGAGKSTLNRTFKVVLSDAFDPIHDQYMGWKQFVLPTKYLLRLAQKISGNRKKSINNLPTEKDPSWVHNLSVLHYFLDLWCRYLFYVRPALMRGGLVLCDRYFYDILIQNVWLCNKPVPRGLMIFLMPTPTIAVLFTGDPEMITKRKQENSVEETSRQLIALSAIKKSAISVVELDAMDVLDKNVLIALKSLFSLSSPKT